MEGISGTAIIYNGAQGLKISGNFFESNGLDIDGTGGTNAFGVILDGNMFVHTDTNQYSVIWGSNILCGVSIGNYHNGAMHSLPANADVFCRDISLGQTYNNKPIAELITDLMIRGTLSNSGGNAQKTSILQATTLSGAMSGATLTLSNLFQPVQW